jgi:hypothetical protein
MAPKQGGHACKIRKPRGPTSGQPISSPPTPVADDKKCTIDDIKAEHKGSLDAINKRLSSLNIDGEFEFLLVKKPGKGEAGGARRRRCVKKGGAGSNYILRCFGVYKKVVPTPKDGQPPIVKINNFVREVIEPVRRLDRRLKTTEITEISEDSYNKDLQERIEAKKGKLNIENELDKKELIIYIANLLFKIRDPNIQVQFGTSTMQYSDKGVVVNIGGKGYLLTDNVYMADSIEDDIKQFINKIAIDSIIVNKKETPEQNLTPVQSSTPYVPEEKYDDVFTIDGIKVTVQSDMQTTSSRQATSSQQTTPSQPATPSQQATSSQQATPSQQATLPKSYQHDLIYSLICP